MFIKEVMTLNPITIQATAPINSLIGLMRDKNLKKVPVLDGAKLVGIVTDKDVEKVSPSEATTLSVFEINYLLSKTLVKDAMVKNPFTCTPNTFVEDAAIIMRDHRINALCIMEGEQLVGIVTESDLFDALIDMFGGRDKGNRFLVEAENVPGVLEKLGQATSSKGINITKFAFTNSVDGKAQLLVRTDENLDIDAVKSALESTGFKVVSATRKL